MDRGGRGREESESSRQGSSLPRTLHGSLLQPGAQEPADVLHEEPQPMTETEGADLEDIPYAAHPSRSARTASLHPPSLATPDFEEGSSRDIGPGIQRSHTTSSERSSLPFGQGRLQDPPPYLPPIQIRPSASSTTDPNRYASALPSSATFYSHQPTPSRQPLVRARGGQSQHAPPTGDSRHHTYPSSAQEVRMWGPAPINRATQLHQHQQQQQHHQEQQHQQSLQWDYNPASYIPDAADIRSYNETFENTRGWVQGARHEDIPSDDSRNLSAARSTIATGWPEQQQFASTSALRDQHYAFPVAQVGPPGHHSRQTHDQNVFLQPYYTTEQYPSAPPPPPYTPATAAAGSLDYRDTHLRSSSLATTASSYSASSIARYSFGPDPRTSGGYQEQHQPLSQQQALQHHQYQQQQQPLPPQQQQQQHQPSQHAPPPQQRVGSVQEESPKSVTPAPSAAASSSRKRKDRDSDDDDDEFAPPRKITKKTQIACNFCRGRKLKCDGQTPTCGNCHRRSNVCEYAPHPKRRGPGKAPKGQKRLAALRAKAAAQGSQTDSVPGDTPASHPEGRASVEIQSRYALLPSVPDTHLSRMPTAAHFDPVLVGIPQHYQYLTSTNPSMGAGRVENLRLRFPEQPVAPATEQLYGGPGDLRRPSSGLSQHLQYPPSESGGRHMTGPGTAETWGSMPPVTTTTATTTSGVMPSSSSRASGDPHDEGRSTELSHEFFYDERPALPRQTPPEQQQ